MVKDREIVEFSNILSSAGLKNGLIIQVKA
jgi:hypothetical protein